MAAITMVVFLPTAVYLGTITAAALCLPTIAISQVDAHGRHSPKLPVPP